ncbi:hypothetical protein RND71_034465 [Anisodus tanguticus]|uniref:Uncharacterized protein n=1 Tax=Anisodus tanguticus TaxID=243964 RepID=A0AAE1RBF7_9SOLA|nr:hypothetical protein RND71_034465 [Anisodus tanguticus]
MLRGPFIYNKVREVILHTLGKKYKSSSVDRTPAQKSKVGEYDDDTSQFNATEQMENRFGVTESASQSNQIQTYAEQTWNFSCVTDRDRVPPESSSLDRIRKSLHTTLSHTFGEIGGRSSQLRISTKAAHGKGLYSELCDIYAPFLGILCERHYDIGSIGLISL